MKEVIVLVAHGTVEDLDDMSDFLLEIRRGRPAPPELISEMRHRYERVGGSPLLRETAAQAAAVQASTGKETRVAMRLWKPRMMEAVSDLGPEDRVILVPLAPYSVEVYEEAAQAELQKMERPPELVSVAPWGDLPDFINAHVDQITRATVGLAPDRCHVILTAHSLPTAVIRAGDRYCEQFEACARAVAGRLEFPSTAAYQSQGAGGGDWVGPDLAEVVRRVADSGVETIVVAPIGFLSEHIETLYDLDIETKGQVESLGKRLVRVPALGTHPGLISAISEAVRVRTAS